MTRFLRSGMIFASPLVAVFVLVYFLGLAPSLDRQAQLRSEIETLQERNRQLSLRLETLLTEQVALVIAPDDLWSFSENGPPIRQLQQTLVRLIGENSLSLRRYGASSINIAGLENSVGIDVEFEGSLENFATLLKMLGDHQPRIAVHDMRIRAKPLRQQIEGETQIDVRLVIWGLSAGDAT